MALIAAHLNAGHSGSDSVAIGIYSPSYSASIPHSPHSPRTKYALWFLWTLSTMFTYSIQTVWVLLMLA